MAWSARSDWLFECKIKKLLEDTPISQPAKILSKQTNILPQSYHSDILKIRIIFKRLSNLEEKRKQNEFRF